MITSVVLDRDGVINQDSEHYIKSADEWLPIEGSIEAIKLLTEKGIAIYIATNQSGVGRGLFDVETLNDIFTKMITMVNNTGGKIKGIVYCPHHPDDNCACRKPKPGLLHLLQNNYQISFEKSIMIGDSLRDLQAAQAVNMNAYLVKTGKGEKTITENPELTGSVKVFNNLLHAVEKLLSEN